MTQSMTLSEYRKLLAGKPKKKNKYNAKITEVDGIKFHSRLEANYYSDLKLRQRAGDILHFHRQVIFDLPGSTRYLCDFMIIYPDNRIEYVDTKGRDTSESRLKRRQVLDLYNIDIILSK